MPKTYLRPRGRTSPDSWQPPKRYARGRATTSSRTCRHSIQSALPTSRARSPPQAGAAAGTQSAGASSQCPYGARRRGRGGAAPRGAAFRRLSARGGCTVRCPGSISTGRYTRGCRCRAAWLPLRGTAHRRAVPGVAWLSLSNGRPPVGCAAAAGGAARRRQDSIFL